MTEKQIILSDFIQTFFEKAKTNRRHNKNTILNLTDISNRVFNLYIGKGITYNEEEILDGFYENGFMILEPKDKNMLTGRTNKGIVKFSSGNHINIKSQNVSDLVSGLRKGYPLKSSSDTILRINKIKESLKQFAERNKKAIVQHRV
jgi:lipopolysaccharide export LptBFGC system permease protein LptF